jgi:hypothetical protein
VDKSMPDQLSGRLAHLLSRCGIKEEDVAKFDMKSRATFTVDSLFKAAVVDGVARGVTQVRIAEIIEFELEEAKRRATLTIISSGSPDAHGSKPFV